ncbi:MAG: metallophosphoesterase [Armatimonadetes bacterium]|nr:metallophosphoesterase [Armatimonadota bacterium]
MLRILHTNDFHGKLTEPMAAWIRAQKTPDTLYFDTGDCIRTGNLGVPLSIEPVWGLLRQAGCDASTLGNRESHPLGFAQRRKVEGAQHPILVANMADKAGEALFERSRVFDVAGLRVGVFGVMVPMVTRTMTTAAASEYLWSQPIPTALEVAEELRPKVDLVIALTHIGIAQDRKLAEAGASIDIILGGHSHTVLEQPERVGSTSICQGGSHGKFLGCYTWDGSALSGGLVPIGELE